MFNPDITPIFKPSVNGRYTSDMENVDIMLNYDSNEFMVCIFYVNNHILTLNTLISFIKFNVIRTNLLA